MLSTSYILPSMKRLQSEVTDEQWNKIKAHLPPPPSWARRLEADRQQAMFRGYLVGAPLWRALAGPASPLSFAEYVLAPFAVLGRRGCLVKCLASVTEGDGSQISPELAGGIL